MAERLVLSKIILDFHPKKKHSLYMKPINEEDIALLANAKCAFVSVNGQKVDLEETEFINIEEDIHGRDLMTFSYKGKEYQSYLTAN